MNNYRFGLYEKALPDKLTWVEKLCAAREAGYDYLEMSIDESDERIARLDWSDADLLRLQETMYRHRMRIESICLSAQRRFPLGSSLPGVADQAIELLAKAILLASKLGVRIIQIQGYDCYYGETSSNQTKMRFFQNLLIGVEMATKYGVILGIETMENEFINTTKKAMFYVDSVKSPYLTIYPDVGNIANATDHVSEDLLSGLGHICAAHLKETAQGCYRNIPYGSGQVDFPIILKTLFDLGVRRLTAEFWHAHGSQWMSVLSGNRCFLENQVKKALDLME